MADRRKNDKSVEDIRSAAGLGWMSSVPEISSNDKPPPKPEVKVSDMDLIMVVYDIFWINDVPFFLRRKNGILMLCLCPQKSLILTGAVGTGQAYHLKTRRLEKRSRWLGWEMVVPAGAEKL